MTHTPGPWIAAWDKDDHHIWANGCDIAFLPGEEQGYECGAKLKTLEANGKLMAAAPELLEALKALASTARTFSECVPDKDKMWTSLDEDALTAALNAIAKATGVEQ